MATVVLPETTRALYPFKSHFLTLSDGKRMHYVDEGPEDGEVLVFAHGYPLWSFVYRAFLVYYAAQGYRCIAMDHIGYGLSDKPTGRHYHTVRRHVHNVMECLTALNVHAVTLVMEDWGCPLALGYAIRYTENVKRLVILNSWAFQDTFPNRLNRFIQWTTRPGIGDLLYSTLNLVFTWGVQHWTARRLSSALLAAYKAPFRDPRNRTALIQFPRMINTAATHPSASTMREIEQGLATLTHIPTLILWGERDSLFPPEVAHHWKELLPRARGPVFMPTASHFPAEDDPDLVIEHLDAFLDRT